MIRKLRRLYTLYKLMIVIANIEDRQRYPRVQEDRTKDAGFNPGIFGGV